MTDVDWFSNDELTRWFLVLRLSRAPRDSLEQLLRISNRRVVDFKQPVLYTSSRSPSDIHRNYHDKVVGQETWAQNAGVTSSQSTQSFKCPSGNSNVTSDFHVSLAWTLSAPTKELSEKLGNLKRFVYGMKIGVNTVKIKVGNNITSIPLNSTSEIIDTSNSIIEH